MKVETLTPEKIQLVKKLARELYDAFGNKPVSLGLLGISHWGLCCDDRKVVELLLNSPADLFPAVKNEYYNLYCMDLEQEIRDELCNDDFVAVQNHLFPPRISFWKRIRNFFINLFKKFRNGKK